MKLILKLFLAGIVVIGTMSFILFSNDGKAGYTNSPGEGNCTNCHSGTVNSGSGLVSITTVPSLTGGYISGITYAVTFTVTEISPNNSLYGIDLEVLQASGANAGTLSITNSNLTKILTSSNGGHTRNNVVHTGNNNTGPNSQNFNFNWTAPVSGTGPITFYASGMAANNNGSTSGDNVYTTNLVVPESNTGINENPKQGIISVFPNPSNGRFLIRSTGEKVLSLEIYNMLSEIVFTTSDIIQNTLNEIDLSNFNDGVYLLKINFLNKTYTEKIVINN